MNITKLTAMVLSLMLIFSVFAGCGSNSAQEEQSPSTSTVSNDNSETPTPDPNAKKDVKLRYALWDQEQAPTYQEIINQFTAETGIEVQLEQLPWGDYWTKVTTQIAGGAAPDLITMFTASFKTLQSKGAFQPIDSYVQADNIDLSNYKKEACDMFTVDGQLYGLPKDFDSFAVFYNKQMLKDAGYDSYPEDLEWNPTDGGTYIEFLQKLTLDKNGKHPNESGFDPKNIVQYGLLPSNREDIYIDGWLTQIIKQNGGVLADEQTGALTLDNPKTFEALSFMDKVFNEWYVAPSVSITRETGPDSMFYAGKAATFYNGPWMVNAVNENSDFEWGIALNPKGPSGTSVSRVNSLVDVIFSGSQYRDEAWELLKYIATTPGQTILGEKGTVIPAYLPVSHTYVDYFQKQGIDVKIFIDAYEGDVVVSPNYNEFNRAQDIALRNFALVSNGKEITIEEAVKNIQEETTDFLVEANKK